MDKEFELNITRPVGEKFILILMSRTDLKRRSKGGRSKNISEYSSTVICFDSFFLSMYLGQLTLGRNDREKTIIVLWRIFIVINYSA
jgi:hypothetical protein